jgi:glycosyltransferase involved in cell wall biosynthesis
MDTFRLSKGPNLIEINSNTPLVSIVIPGYNEASVISKNLEIVCNYMKSIEEQYSWELIFINDGSIDDTGSLAEIVQNKCPNVKVFHHHTNFNLGQALRYGFNNSSGKYIITFDADLSYSVDHIERLLSTIISTKAKIVIASPYMKGGKVSNVPIFRKFLSYWANQFLKWTATGNINTITGMVRAYDRIFLQSLNTKSMDMAINPEIIYKAQLLRAVIVEIPAHLNWGPINDHGKQRKSSLKIFWTILSFLFSGYIFRPFIFFILPGIFLSLISFYPIGWAFFHAFSFYKNMDKSRFWFTNVSESISQAFTLSPQSFVIGGIALMVSIQLFSIGILSLQKKRYFEELFHLQTNIYKCLNQQHFRKSR